MIRRSLFLAVLIMMQGSHAAQEEGQLNYIQYQYPALHADRVACIATVRFLIFILGVAGTCALLRKLGYIE